MADSMNRGLILVNMGAVQAAPPSSVEVYTINARTLQVLIDVAAVNGAQALTVYIEVQNPASKNWVTLLASAAISSVGSYVLQVGAGLPNTSNFSANQVVGERMRVRCAHASATDTIQYAVGVNLGH